MWIFNPSGLLMPADVPMNLANPHYTRGYRDLQVRARVESHLTNFIRERMEPLGLDYSEIEATPGMDYDFRFYTRRSDFALAIADEIMNIDYEKFKPTAERKGPDGKPLYKDGAAYHSKLNSIWGVLASLGRPYGGNWGSSTRTGSSGGYRSGSSYGSQGSRVGDSFGQRAAVAPERRQGFDFDDDSPRYGGFGSTKPTAASLASVGIRPDESRQTPMFRDIPDDFDKDILDDREIDGSVNLTSLLDDEDRDDEAFESALQELGLGTGFHEVREGDEDDENDAPTRTISQLRELAAIIPTKQWSQVFTPAEIDYLLDKNSEDAAEVKANPETGEVEDEEPVPGYSAGELSPEAESVVEERQKPEGEFATESNPDGGQQIEIQA